MSLLASSPDRITGEVAVSGAPPYGVSQEEVPRISSHSLTDLWQRPAGPPRVGIQVGHWKNEALPDELERLRGNTGAKGGGKWEWEVNYAIAQHLAQILKSSGVVVEILPATVPPRYWADIFIAIHADGNLDPTKRGYKFAGPWRDLSGRADQLVSILNQTYKEHTNLEYDPNISRNMRGYYAFSWWRNQHAIHPMTTGVIAETGFLTNPQDRQLLINQPEISAQGIAAGIITYLTQENLL